MTNYFEKLVSKFNGRTQKVLPLSAYLMLERYDKLNAESLDYYEKHENCNDEELREFYWKRCCEVSCHAKGLLDAYEILTNRKVNATPYAIRNEKQWLSETFDLEEN